MGHGMATSHTDFGLELFDVLLTHPSKPSVIEWRERSGYFAVAWAQGFNKAQEQRGKPWVAKVIPHVKAATAAAV
jgi:hypothetical protein